MKFLLFLFSALSSSAFTQDFRFEVEGNLAWQSRNAVRIPSQGGTDFSLTDFGRRAAPTGRFSLFWRLAENHELKALIFPFSVSGSGQPATAINFQGQTFSAGVPTESNYKFHSYRLTYRYQLVNNDAWGVKVGLTVKIRNARIALQQGAVLAEKTDVGFVPLLHVNVRYAFTPQFRVELDADALAAPQGRAEDVSLLAWHKLGDRFEVGGGYRLLEGGASNNTVYTFTFLHFLSVNAAVLF